MENNLADSLALHARARAQQVAVIDGERSLTYAQLHSRVLALARSLLSNRLRPGDIVGLCLRDHLEHVLCLWACARAGLVMLPLDWRWTSSERESVVRHFKACCAITEPDIPVAACASLTWEELQSQPAGWSEDAVPATSLQSPLLISLSSGTTGRPKGPMLTHRHFLRRFWTHWINLGLNANSRYLNATPLYFGGARTFTLSVLFSGGTVILHPPNFDPVALARTVQQHRVNALFLVPTQLRRLLASPQELRNRFRKLRLLLSSGAPLQANERVAIRNQLCAQFHEYYASTEGGGVSLCTPEDFDLLLTSVGRPIYGVDVSIVDAHDTVLAPGHVGQLRYRGPGVAEGFFNDAEQTRQHFRDGWFYPGDLAEQNADGYLFLRGRSKDVVNRAGVNIYPNEIEDTLMQIAGLRECAVFGLPDPELGECVACAWVGEPGLTRMQLVSHCQARLAPYKLPGAWLELETLPRNSAGKVVLDALKKSFAAAKPA